MDRLPQVLAECVSASPLRQRIPQAEIACGDAGGAVVLRVLDAPDAADRAAFLELGLALDVDIYLQTGGPDTVSPLGSSPRPLYYRLAAHDVRLDFEPGDFIQIKGRVNELMVDAVITAAEPRAGDRVLDLYCGLGNFSLPFARLVAHVTGVEGLGSLVARAARNAANNGIDNTRVVSANLDGGDWPFFREAWDLVVLDPARAGAASAMGAMARMRPRRVVYVSCHPGTLARDAGTLVREHGYRLTSARVLDMFPHTHHVEAITVFDRDA
jgi:23S rRNA (uracil1939-C5)-methyltransferase